MRNRSELVWEKLLFSNLSLRISDNYITTDTGKRQTEKETEAEKVRRRRKSNATETDQTLQEGEDDLEPGDSSPLFCQVVAVIGSVSVTVSPSDR